MAKFMYRMQNILDIKYKMENQARSAYANAKNRLDAERGRLEELFSGKRSLENRYRELAQGSLNVRDLLDGRRAIDYQKELIKVQMVEVRVAEKNFEVAGARLGEIMKDRKTHEKLRERAFEDFLVELGAQEKKEIDELVSYRYGAGREESEI
ncbi:MAG: flagellar export protein FliJ [Butyrivibrio sp.]|nr:flagellar export protein FliJ [Butyrivibrio sp.]